MKKSLILGALALGGCMNMTPPAQPTPASIETNVQAIATISPDPATTWQVADYAVRTACDAYLDEMAQRSANLGLAQAGAGTAGIAAAGFAASAGSPVAAALASSAGSLVQTFLGEFQSSGALPYSAETSSIIDDAMSAYESAAAPPATTAGAMVLAEGLWRLCSPVGYAELVAKSISTASVTAGGAAPVTESLALGAPRPVPAGKPHILVNGR